MIDELIEWTTDKSRMDGQCTSKEVTWSILDSSPPNANLAAVLAGFMVTAIVFLLDRQRHEHNRATTNTIALFFPGVLILGLNSYLFGSIASMGPQVALIETSMPLMKDSRITVEAVQPQNLYICGLVWSQGLAASGMLAVGGILLIAGLGWIITQFARESDKPSRFFLLLGNLLTTIVIVATLLLLAETSDMYIKLMGSKSIAAPVDPFARTAAWAYFGVIIFCCCAIIAKKSYRLYRAGARTEFRDYKFPAVYLACVVTAFLALAGPIYGRIAADAQDIGSAQVRSAIVLCLVIPGLIYLLVAMSAPEPRVYPKGAAETKPRPKLPAIITVPLLATLLIARRLQK